MMHKTGRFRFKAQRYVYLLGGEGQGGERLRGFVGFVVYLRGSVLYFIFQNKTKSYFI